MSTRQRALTTAYVIYTRVEATRVLVQGTTLFLAITTMGRAPVVKMAIMVPPMPLTGTQMAAMGTAGTTVAGLALELDRPTSNHLPRVPAAALNVQFSSRVQLRP